MASTEELAIVVRMRDFASRGFASIGKTVAGFASGAAKHIFSLRGALVGLGAGWAGLRLVERAANIESISMAFQNLAKDVGGADAVLAALRTGTRNTVSDFKLMETANKAILLGVGQSAQEFEVLSTLARRLGRAVGRDTVDAFNDLAIGIGRQSRLILDNLGLIVKVEDANKRYAATLGKTTDELTDAEKRTAFMEATLEAARVRVASLGEDTWTLGDAWGKLKATFANVADSLVSGLTPAIRDLIASIGEKLEKGRGDILRFFADITEFLGGFGADAIRIGGEVISVFETLFNLGPRLREVSRGLWKSLGFSYENIDKEWQDLITKDKEALALLEANAERRAAATEKIATIAAATIAKVTEKLREYADEAEGGAEKQRDLVAATWEFIGPMEQIYGPIDLAAKAIAMAAEKQEELNARFEEGKRVADEYAEKFKNIQTALSEAAGKWKAEQEEISRISAAKGAKEAFETLRRESRAWGTAIKGVILDVTNMLGSRLTDGILEIAENFKNAGRAAEAMGKQILRDFGRIITQMLVMKALQAGIGGLGGLLPLGAGGALPGSLRPAVVSGRAAAGRRITHRGLYELAEAGQPEVVLPLRGGAVRAEIRGGSDALMSRPSVEVKLAFHYAPSFVSPSDEERLLARNAKFIAEHVTAEVQRSLTLQEGWRR